MQVRLARWGNSLGLRIPQELADRLALNEGVWVEVKAEGDRLIIKTDKPRYKLEELLAGITPEDMHEAFNWGSDVGREVVE